MFLNERDQGLDLISKPSAEENTAVSSKFDLLDLYLSLSEMSGEEQLDLIKKSAEKLVKELEMRFNSGKAELFLETLINSDEVFKYLENEISEAALRNFDFNREAIINELKQDFDPIIIDTLVRVRTKFIDVLKTEIVERGLNQGQMLFGDKKRTLGKGGLGEVSTFEAQELSASRILGLYVPKEEIPLAIKVFNEKDNKFAKNNEANQMLQTLEHPNLMKFFGYADLKNEKIAIQEFIPGGLAFLEALENKNLSLYQKLEIIEQAMYGCLELNKKGLAHNDIKPANIVVVLDTNNEVQSVKLIDYDAVNFIGKEQDKISGTPGWIAPERLKRPHASSHKSDVYAFGVMLCKILFNSIPHLERITDYLAPEEYFERNGIDAHADVKGEIMKLIEIEENGRLDLEGAIKNIQKLKHLAETNPEYFENKPPADLVDQNVSSSVNKKASTLISGYLDRQSAESVKVVGNTRAGIEQEIAKKESLYQHYGVIESAKEYLSEYPDSAGAWFLLGESYENVGDLIKAKEAYEKACKFGKDSDQFESYNSHLIVVKERIKKGHSDDTETKLLAA